MYPRAAVAATVFVVRRGVIDARVVALVTRGRPPAAGLLALPGGKIRLGEPMAAATARELLEETGLRAEFPNDPCFCATDAITWDSDRVAYHYSICHLIATVNQDTDELPALAASSDAAHVIWAATAAVLAGQEIGGLPCVDGTARVVSRAIEEWRRRLPEGSVRI